MQFIVIKEQLAPDGTLEYESMVKKEFTTWMLWEDGGIATLWETPCADPEKCTWPEDHIDAGDMPTHRNGRLDKETGLPIREFIIQDIAKVMGDEDYDIIWKEML